MAASTKNKLCTTVDNMAIGSESDRKIRWVPN